MCRCRACNSKLSSRELTRKYADLPPNVAPEDQYIGLCTACFNGSELVLAVTNPLLSDNDGELSTEPSIFTLSSFDVFEQDEQGVSPAVTVDKDFQP